MDERLVLVDSRKRDPSAVGTANSYTMQFLHPIKDIIKVDLVFATMNLATNTLMYGLLDIEQFRTRFAVSDMRANVSYNVTTTNIPIANQQAYDVINTFAVLPIVSALNVNWQEGANFRHSVHFQQPIESLDRLTIRWTDRNGTPIVFGAQENQILLRIYTVQKPAPTEREPELPPPMSEPFRVPKEVILVVLIAAVSLLIIA